MAKKYWDFKTYVPGLEAVFQDYQQIVMEYLWEIGKEGAGSGKCWLHTNKILKEKEKTISRASIIFFLNDMVDHDILKYREMTGKGGHRRIYHSEFDETGFKEHLAKTIISKLMQEFPEETKTAIGKLQRDRS